MRQGKSWWTVHTAPGPFGCCHQLSSSQLKNPLSWQQADEYGKDEKGVWLKEAHVFDISMRFKDLETYPFEKRKGANGGDRHSSSDKIHNNRGRQPQLSRSFQKMGFKASTFHKS